MLLRACHYRTGERIDVQWRDGIIQALGPATACQADHEAGWIAPALFDLQINGCLGHGFHHANLDNRTAHAMVTECRRHGIASFLPTLITNSLDALASGMATLRRLCEVDPVLARAMPGIHLEGPYISPEDGPRGAHPIQHVRKPSWDEFRQLQDAAGGRIRLVTLAPELEEASDFIRMATASGVVVAIGHTAATGERIRAAIAAGARLSTHLGNGCHARLPRHDNSLWEQLAADELWASLITDGHHLPQPVVRCLVRGKTPARIILTCDASPLAGLPPGRYREWEQDFEVLPGGKVIVPGTPFLGGSGTFTDHCLATLLHFTDVCLGDAVDMAGARPRELLGLPAQRLEAGARTDVILFDWHAGGDFFVRETRVG